MNLHTNLGLVGTRTRPVHEEAACYFHQVKKNVSEIVGECALKWRVLLCTSVNDIWKGGLGCCLDWIRDK